MRIITAKTAMSFVAGAIFLSLCVFVLNYCAGNYYKSAYPNDYKKEIESYSEKFAVPTSLIFAVVRTESSFRPDVVSSIGARGLMQLTKETFDWVKSKLEPTATTTYDSMFTPEINIRYGTFLLSMLAEEFGSTENALCAYHAGWGNAKKWLKDGEYSADGQIHTIPFEDTRRYVGKVMETAKIYKKLYGS